ncbi:MAG: DCC1-like thiol-disulfide oxidoreductase family protein [Cyclobacteriaceae bacterium]
MGANTQVADKNIVFFDGVCNLCNSAVDVILRRDYAGKLYFASLQSDFAANFLPRFGMTSRNMDSVIFYANGRLYDKSSAILEIAKHLRFYRYFYFLKIVPKIFRDFIYSMIANSRYSVFGKKDTCRIATEDEKERFLDS